MKKLESVSKDLDTLSLLIKKLFKSVSGDVLILEDSPSVVEAYKFVLDESHKLIGLNVVIATNNDEAIKIINENKKLVAAVVDFYIYEETSVPICELLANRKIPFIISTASPDDCIVKETAVNNGANVVDKTLGVSKLFKTICGAVVNDMLKKGDFANAQVAK